MIVLQSLVLILAFFACVTDVKTGKVNNYLLAAGALAGFVFYVKWAGLYGLPAFFAGGLIPLVPGFWLFHYRMIGAGDVKLLTVLGCIIGTHRGIPFLVWTILIAGGFSALKLMKNGNLNERLIYLKSWCHQRFVEGERVPYRREHGTENFHMTIPILCAAILYAGGVI